jgi:hypothetical protein
MRTECVAVAVATVLALNQAGAQQDVQAQAQKTVKSWIDNMTIKGDVGYRFELISEEGKDDQQRDRIRVRLGAETKVADDLKTEIELSSGGANPISAYQTIGDSFGRKEFRLNLAYLQWKPADGATLTGGKMRNPFVDVGCMIWDADVTPEGLAAQASQKIGAAQLLAAAGYLWIQERSAADDTRLYAGQIGVKFALSDAASLLVGGSYYGFDQMEGVDVVDWENKGNAYGNSTVRGTVSGSVTNKAYATDFGEVEGFAKLAMRVGIPVEVYGQYAVNLDADANDTAYLGGVTLGKASAPKTAEAGYLYRRVEKDATPGFMTDSETWGGGTDGRGHRVFGRYQLAKAVQVCANYFMSEKSIADEKKTHDYDKFNAEVVVKF